MTDPENKGRRVSDQDLLDSAKQAVRLEELNGRQNLLSLQITNGLQAMRSAVEGTQSEVHRVAQTLETLAAQQRDHGSNKDSLDSLRKEMQSMSTRMEKLFSDHATVQDRKWEIYSADRDSRWREHEADNENTSRDIRGEIKDIREVEVRRIREKLIRWTGWGAGVGALVMLIGTGFLYHLNYRFNENDFKTDRLQIESRQHGEALQEIKLYLARGGRIPPENSGNQRTDRND